MSVVAELFALVTDADSAQDAIVFYEGRKRSHALTYRELRLQAFQVAARLRSNGVEAGDRVALLSRNSGFVAPLVLGAWALGASVLPLNATGDPADWCELTERAGARLLVASVDYLPSLADALFDTASFPVIELEALFAAERCGSSPLPVEPSERGRPGVVLFTSGTTGGSKGVILPLAKLMKNASLMARRLDLARPKHLAVLPLYHAHALGVGLLSTLLTRGTLILTDGLEPFTWSRVISDEGVTFTSLVPHMLPLLQMAGVEQCLVPSLRGILVSSAPLAPRVAREFVLRTKIELLQGWGLSEFCNFATCTAPGAEGQGARRALLEEPCVGTCLDEVQVTVRDAEGREIPDGRSGELWIEGPCIMDGYDTDPRATADVVTEQGLRTGDLGYVRDIEGQRCFFVSGRLKETIIRAGEKFAPVDLERKLQAHVASELEYAIVGFPHQHYGEEVGLVVRTKSESDLDALRGALETMQPAERPKVVVLHPGHFPKTHTGKLQRRALVRHFRDYGMHTGRLVIATAAT